MKRFTFVGLALLTVLPMFSQSYNVNRIGLTHMGRQMNRKIVRIPHIGDGVVLKCDFHSHTVYSDGNVWPQTRVTEAWTDGLDVLSITDHLRPAGYTHENLKGDDNRSFEQAKPVADELGMMLVRGTEISKGKPDGGHLNALFITDAVNVNRPTAVESVEAALQQGALIQWNHPGWAIDSCKMFPVNEQLIKEGKIHAVEVFNSREWYPRALSWCKEYGLSPMANTDQHYATGAIYGDAQIRPMTLVFAKEKSLDALKKAIMERRTVAFFDGQLAGAEEWLSKIVKASLQIVRVGESRNGKETTYQIINETDIPFITTYDNEEMVFTPQSITLFSVPKGTSSVSMKFHNLHTYENKNLTCILDLN